LTVLSADTTLEKKSLCRRRRRFSGFEFGLEIQDVSFVFTKRRSVPALLLPPRAGHSGA
jgi:hypothetical protein